MRNLIASLLRYRPLVIVALVAWIAGGIYMFLRLDIEAYPDPSPPLVEVITQNPSWSAEEMEAGYRPHRNRSLRHPPPRIRSIDRDIWPQRREALL